MPLIVLRQKPGSPNGQSSFFFSLRALNLLIFVSFILIEPHGQFDAWYIWNARARFLFRGGAYWADGFSPLVAHADYPLLIPLIISILLARLTAPWLGRKVYGRTMLSSLAGLLPVMLIVLGFKILLAPPNDLFGTRGLEDLLQKLLDFPRHAFILRFFGLEAWYFGHWPFFSILPVLAIYAGVLGLSQPGVGKTVRPFLISLGLMIVGFYVTFLVTPHDLSWCLGTALGRLFLQLWPSILFLYFLMISPPDAWFERHTFS